jgi:signal peptidase II
LATSVGCDQSTKQLAKSQLRGAPGFSYWGDLFRLQYAENHGAFLSFGASFPEGTRYLIFTVAVGALLAFVLGVALFKSGLDFTSVSGYALLAGGGLSNWVDRAFRGGSVVDFMNLGIGSLRTGIFNVADVLILVGIGLVLLSPTPGKTKPAEPPP